MKGLSRLDCAGENGGPSNLAEDQQSCAVFEIKIPNFGALFRKTSTQRLCRRGAAACGPVEEKAEVILCEILRIFSSLCVPVN